MLTSASSLVPPQAQRQAGPVRWQQIPQVTAPNQSRCALCLVHFVPATGRYPFDLARRIKADALAV
eukprot:3669660-Rhodomonas_salina.1